MLYILATYSGNEHGAARELRTTFKFSGAASLLNHSDTSLENKSIIIIR